MPALKDEDFTEEGKDESSEDDSEEDDEESEEGTTEDEETTENDGETEGGTQDDEDDDEDDDDNDDGDDEDEDEETKDGKGDEDESENDDNDDFKDEEGLISGEPSDKKEKDAQKSKHQIIAGLGCCLLVLLGLGLGLGLGLKKDDEPSPPTPVPTGAPTSLPPTNIVPSSSPTGENETMAPSDDEMIDEATFLATADTTIYVDGQFAGNNFGLEDTMLVQGGRTGDPDLARAYSLVQFELNATELAAMMRPADVEMCLDHLPTTENTRSSTYFACVVPFSSPVDELTGSNVSYVFPGDCVGGQRVSFNVTPADRTICTLVSDMVFDFLATNATKSRLRRRKMLQSLQIPLVMAIENPDESEQPGDRFYTSNDPGGRIPILGFTSTNSTDDSPTAVPTFDSTSNGTVPESENDPCNICGGTSIVTSPDAQVPGSEGRTCGEVQQGCQLGLCSPDICQALPALVNSTCGCTEESGDVGI